MKNYPEIILCFILMLFIQSINAQKETCENDDALLEDLNSITKCTVEETKDRNHKRRKRINIVVSPNTKRRVLKKKATSALAIKKDAKLGALKKNTALVGKLEVMNSESLINKLPFNAVEEKPLFKACTDIAKDKQSACFNSELVKHIKKELKYPKRALWHRMSGRVLVQFMIDDKGKVVNIQVKRTKNNRLLENEAERIISELPDFVPGKVNGKAVYVNKGVPINFTLPEEYRTNKKSHKNLENILALEDADVIAEFASCKNTPINNRNNCFNREMIKHVEKNFKYPKSASEDGIEGRVNATFVISKKGNVIKIQVTGPKNGRILERSAVKLLEKLPKFSPAIKNDKPIDVKYSLPIDFKID